MERCDIDLCGPELDLFAVSSEYSNKLLSSE
jgi:hypothetical protein